MSKSIAERAMKSSMTAPMHGSRACSKHKISRKGLSETLPHIVLQGTNPNAQ